MKNLSPIKKLVLGMAAVAVTISLITANNLASVMLIVASREVGTNQTVQTNTSGNTVVGNNSGSSSSTGNTSTGNTSTGNTSTGNTSNDNAQTVTPPSSGTSTNTNDAGNSGSSDSGASTDAPSGDKNDAPAGDAGDKNEADKPAEDNAGGKEKTTAEIVDMYKKAVNNAKTNAKSVVRVRDGALNYKGHVQAGALSSAASSLMGMFMVADEASIEVKNEPFTNNDIPPANATSNLTEAGVVKAECKEEGDYYIVTIVAKDQVNPTAGADGVGSVSSVIEEGTITGSISSVPGLSLSNISIAYENVTAVAKIEKSTGNLVNIKTDAPCILSLDAKLLLASIEGAEVGIEVISEFAMTY